MRGSVSAVTLMRQLVRDKTAKRTVLFVVFSVLAVGNVYGQSAKINVAVSILPLAEFVEQIGGDRVSVTVMIPPGANPHAYEPVPSQMAALSQARLYVKVGSGLQFETLWMEKLQALNSGMAICDAGQGIALRDADKEPGHHHAGTKDPHIWLSPLNARKMVENIRDALVRIDPAHETLYKTNTVRYTEQIDALHEDISMQIAGLQRRSFMVFHPAWGYFADTYGLREVAIEQEGKEPSARELAGLIARARQERITTVLVSPHFSQRSAEVIARELGGTVAAVDDLAKDYIVNLQRVAQVLAKEQE